MAVSRFRGENGPEVFYIDVFNASGSVIAKFHDRDRGSEDFGSWTGLNLNVHELSFQDGRPSSLEFNVTDPDMAFRNSLRRGLIVRAAYGNPMADCVLSYDMETLNASGQMFDLSLNGVNGTITGTPTDEGGYWFRARRIVNGQSIQSASFSVGSSSTYIIWGHFPLAGNDVSWWTAFRWQGGSNDHPILIRKSDNLLGWFDNATSTGFRSSGYSVASLTGWHMITAVHDSSVPAVRFFVDNTLVGTSSGLSTPATTALLTVGTHALSQSLGDTDEPAVINRALTNIEVVEWFNRGGQSPRFYFRGRISSIGHKDGITDIAAIGLEGDAAEYEVYDMIYEGMQFADNVKPSMVIKQYISYHPADVEHNAVHAHLADVDAAELAGAHKAFDMKLEISDQGAYQGGFAFNYNIHGGATDWSRRYFEFSATATNPGIIAVLINDRGKTDLLTMTIHVPSLSGEQKRIHEALVTTVGSATFQWYWFDFTAQAGKLVIGNTYVIGLQPGTEWPATTPLQWGFDPNVVGRSYLWIDENGNNWVEAPGASPARANLIILMEDNYKEMDEEDYKIKTSSSGNKLVAEIISGDIAEAETSIDRFFRATYFYSKNVKMVSDVAKRIAAKVNMNVLFGSGSLATTTPLGFYVPQGGTAYEHMKQLADFVGEDLTMLPPDNFLFTRTAQATISPPNPSFERFTGNYPDEWTPVEVDAATVRTTTDNVWSGDRAVRFNLGVSGVAQGSAIYADISDFDHSWTDSDGTNARLSLYNPTAWVTGTFFKVLIFNHGSFADEKAVLTISLPPAGTRQEVRFKIDRPYFRIYIKFEATVSLAVAVDAYVDDIQFHPRGRNGFVVIDPTVVDEDYTSGFVPGTRPPSTTTAVHFIDDFVTPPAMEEETGRRVINTAIQFGKAGTGRRAPIVAIARNPKRAADFGERLATNTNESLRRLKDAYQRAKQKIRFDARYRAGLNLTGQFPHLFGKSLWHIFPSHGMRDAQALKITGLVVGPTYTELRYEKSITEEFVDVEKLNERRSQIEAAMSIPDTPFYLSIVDLPSSIATASVFQFRLVDEIGGLSPLKVLEKVDEREDGKGQVWTAMIGTDEAGFNTTGTAVWKFISIRDINDVFLVDVLLKEEFAKLPNQFISVWIFGP